MANQNFQRAPGKGKFMYTGMDLRNPPDLMPQGKTPYILNMTPNPILGGMETRAGLDNAGATGAGAVTVHSLKRVNNPLPGATNAYVRFAAALTAMYYAVASAPTTYSALTGVYSGNPLALVPYRPQGSPETWLYAYDSALQSKYRTDGTVQNIGILPPTQPMSMTLYIPNERVLLEPFNATSWTSSGAFGAVTYSSTRIPASTTVSTILYDTAPALSTGWCTIAPTNAAGNYSAFTLGARFTIGGSSETTFVTQVFPKLSSSTVAGSMYAVGYGYGVTINLITIQTAQPIQGLQRYMIVKIGSVYTQVRSVTVGPDDQYSFQCVLASAPSVGATVSVPFSFRAFTISTYAATAALTGGMIQSTITGAGTGIMSLPISSTDLTVSNTVYGAARPLTDDDYIHVGLMVDNPANLTEIHVMLDVDSTTNDFAHNFYYYVVLQSNYQGVAMGTTTAYNSQISALQNSIALQSVELTSSGPALNSYPDENQASTSAPGSDQMTVGKAQWFDLIIKYSDLTRAGSDPSAGLNQVKAIGLLVVSSGTMVVSTSGWWTGGSYGPDVNYNSYGNQGLPIKYRYRYRSSLTGAVSDVSPPTRYGELPWRMGVQLDVIASADPQVDLVDIERNGGTFDTWSRFWTAPNVNAIIVDGVRETLAAAGEPLELKVYAPWPITDKPRAGVCNVVGTSIAWVSGDLFNLNWARGSEIIINSVTYTLYAPPGSTQYLETTENVGVFSNVPFLLPEATIVGFPLPYVCLGMDGRMFADGDPYNPGNLYFSVPYNPDSASDQGYIEVTGPSDPIYQPVYKEGAIYVPTARDFYRVESTPGQTNPYSAYKLGGIPTGLAAPWAITGDGPLIAWIGNDGFYGMTAGGAADMLSGDLIPLFPTESRPGLPVSIAGYVIYPPDYTQKSKMRVSFSSGLYYFNYLDTQGGANTLVYDPTLKGWRHHQYAPGVAVHYEEEGVLYPQTLCGGLNGSVYAVSAANADDNVPFSCVLITPADDQGETRARKQYGDLMLDYVYQNPPSVPNMLINQSGLVVNAYNSVAGRGDYFNQASGTSEGQFLLLLGMLAAYQATGNNTAFSLASKLLDALPVLYRTSTLTPPATVTPTAIFAPHWLFCVKAAFQSATIHYHVSAQFTSGVAVIPDSTVRVRYVFQVVSPTYTLVYQSPYSPLASGTAYAVASTSYNSSTAATTITLTNLTVNATLAVILSASDGPTITVNQPYEAWPDWRPLAAGEIDAACDTLNWAYRAYSAGAAAFPLYASWCSAAATATAQQAAIVYNINDSRDWLKPNYQLLPFATSGSYLFTSMSPAPIVGCDASGNVTTQILPTVTSGETQFGIASINDTYAAGNTTQITVGSTIAQTLTVFIDTTNQLPFDPTNRYNCTLTLNGTGLQSFTKAISAFVNASSQPLPVNSTVYTFGFDDVTTAPHTLTMSRVRQLPNLTIQYLGGAIPFTANFLGQPATLISWRGPVYMGYQSPWMLKKLGQESNAGISVQMLADSQSAWTTQSATHDVGPFAPVFYFQRTDATQYGPANTFGWSGPDPNTGWVGYQFRPLAELAELVQVCIGSEAYYAQATTTVNLFLTWLNSKWTSAIAGPPTAFPQTGAVNTYQEPHAAALVLRTVLKMDQASRPNGNNSGAMNATYSSLLSKVMTMYTGLYQTNGAMAGTFCADVPNQSWYGFWHGEILRSLSLLYTWASNPNINQSAYAAQAVTWISGMVTWAALNTR